MTYWWGGYPIRKHTVLRRMHKGTVDVWVDKSWDISSAVFILDSVRVPDTFTILLGASV
jgi:hypothetical protein